MTEKSSVLSVLSLFIWLVVLRALDIITTSIAFAVGLGHYEANPIAAVLMSYHVLWLGNALALIVVGMICVWLVNDGQPKYAVWGLYIANILSLVVVCTNGVALWMVMY